MSNPVRLPIVFRAIRAAVARAARTWTPYVLAATTVYVVSALLGFAVGTGNGAATMLPVADHGDAFVAPDAASLFVHNAVVSLQVVVGALLGGLPSVYLLGYNGFVLGHVVSSGIGEFGAVTTVALLAPHGVFELPAVWIAGAVSLRWVHVGARVATATTRSQPVAITMIETLAILVLATGLLGVAALVEATVTPELANATSTILVASPS